MRVLSAMILSAVLALPFASAGLAETAGRITVTGFAAVDVVPDMATISLGVTTQSPMAAEAMSANSAALAAVMARLTEAGVAARDMQTSNLSLYPNWVSYDSNVAPKIDGYIATNILTVRVRALETTGAVLDAVITEGANTLNGLTFGLSAPRPAEDAARKAAVADAIARATLLVTAAGVGLGPIVSISEGAGVEPPMPMFDRVAEASVPVASGEISVSASVTVVFEIKN